MAPPAQSPSAPRLGAGHQPGTETLQISDKAHPGAVTAVLGPTNTGKTHLAIERLVGHETGMIGLPLRLLAREVYSRVVDRVGAKKVALITGEERIIPAEPRFWVCTVEAMPQDLSVAFVAIDEIQLAANLERGHVFTQRLLHMRGTQETLLLGAATMRPILERLLPRLHVITRPRLSNLTYVGQKKLTRQPERSAIVAFSANEVYEIAELIRRQRGGAAVVLGSLSPRTRNAQVALYQSGDVDFLVATDAVGMGLNLDVHHVAFASKRKFDGFQFRDLTPSEWGQIAGRAGRHLRDGSFGVTGRVPPLEEGLVKALEAHEFKPIDIVQWRNTALNYDSLTTLRATLDAVPQTAGLTRAPLAEDIQALDFVMRDEDVPACVTSPSDVERLWGVCQIPDYRKIAPANHGELVRRVFLFLAQQGRIAADWMAEQIAFADRTEGDIDTLANRLAHIRTWTFVANRPDWLDDPAHWRETTRAVEDRLSDALHDCLTQRFVDRRTSVLMRRLRENADMEAEITPDGDVKVADHLVGHLVGFRFTPDPTAEGPDAKTVRAAANQALARAIEARADRVARAEDKSFLLDSDCSIRWDGAVIGRLVAGSDVLAPRVLVLADEQLNGPPRDAVQERLERLIAGYTATLLKPLFELKAAEDLTGLARGLAFQLVEALGVLERPKVADDVKQLDQTTRAAMRKCGVRFGAYHIFIPALLKPAPARLLVDLWALFNDKQGVTGLDDVPRLLASGRTSLLRAEEISDELYLLVGFKACGDRAVRIDILERLADLIRPIVKWRPQREKAAKTEPAQPPAAEPRPDEPSKAEPSRAASSKAEPLEVEPLKAELTRTEVCSSKVTSPEASSPEVSSSEASSPEVSSPQAEQTEPPTTEPPTTEPSPTAATPEETSKTEPGTTETGVPEAGTTETGKADEEGGQPSDAASPAERSDSAKLRAQQPSTEPPYGAIPSGGGFRVTVGMMSLLGASGESFASVLKALGYRLDRKKVTAEELAGYAPLGPVQPKAAEKPATGPKEAATPPVDDQATPEASLGAASGLSAESSPGAAAVDAAAPSQAEALEDQTSAPLEEKPQSAPSDDAEKGATPDNAEKAEAAAMADPPPAGSDAVDEGAPPKTPEGQAPEGQTPGGQEPEDSPEAAPEEALYVEIWRPAGRGQREGRRPSQRHARSRGARSEKARADGAGLQRDMSDRANRGTDARQAAHPGTGRDPAQDTGLGEKASGKGQGKRGNSGGKRQWDNLADKAASHRGKPPHKGGSKKPYQQQGRSQGPKRASDRIDPDSPFAKLAQLKSDLEKKKS